jgi:hypothetical protein
VLVLLTVRNAASSAHVPLPPSAGQSHVPWLKSGEWRRRVQNVTLTWFPCDLTPERLLETNFEGAEHDGAGQKSLSRTDLSH